MLCRWEALDRVRHAGHAGDPVRSRDPKMTHSCAKFSRRRARSPYRLKVAHYGLAVHVVG
eukprot:2298051-Prymnesium_polylepis.2